MGHEFLKNDRLIATALAAKRAGDLESARWLDARIAEWQAACPHPKLWIVVTHSAGSGPPLMCRLCHKGFVPVLEEG